MKKYTIWVGLVVSVMILPASLSSLSTVHYVAEHAEARTVEVEKVEPKANKEIVEDLVDKYSAKYGVSKTAMLRTLKNENNTFEFCRQSDMKYKAGNRWGFPAGTREKSYGVAQIHLPDNKVTKEQACDPEFSVEFMAKHFAMGKQRMWMGYSKS